MPTLTVERDGREWLLSFDYDPEAVTLVKRTLYSRRWDKDRQKWVVPLSCTYDIVALANEMGRQGWAVSGREAIEMQSKIDRALGAAPRAKTVDELHKAVANHYRKIANGGSFDFHLNPYGHQEAGVAWLTAVHDGILADEMGLGKTKQLIDYARLLFRDGAIERVVIVCPATLKRNWQHEIEMNCGDESHSVFIVRGVARQRLVIEEAARHAEPPVWVIFNYEQLLRSKRFEALCDGALLVADEAHRLKNEEAKQTEAFTASVNYAKRIVLMTGTPVVNKAEDLYNLVDLVSPGRLGASRWAFQDRHAVVKREKVRYKGGKGKKREVRRVVGYRNLDAVTQRIAPVMLRRTKAECLDLPPKIPVERAIEMAGEQDRAYAELVERLQTNLADSNGEPVEVRVKSAATLLLRLQQVADGFVGDGVRAVHFTQQAKQDAMDDLVEDLVYDAGGKLVIWTRFLPPIGFLTKRFAKLNPVVIYGDVPQDDRHDLAQAFQEDDRVRLFIGQIQTAGVGLNLYAASDQVFLSRWWSPTPNTQAEDRLHRIGQKNPVSVTRLVALPGPQTKKALKDKDPKAIDEIVGAVLDRKQDLADTLTGDLGVLSDLSEIMKVAGK
jgi:SNF2 family DNA or RNA helicase